MGIHLGKIIEQKMNDKGIKPAFLAEKLNTSLRNLYTIFTREEFKTTQLAEISEVLEHDFFQYVRPTNLDLKRTNIIFPDYAEEPHEQYVKPPKVKVTIEIDGTEKNLKKWISIITDFNKTIKDNQTKYIVV